MCLKIPDNKGLGFHKRLFIWLALVAVTSLSLYAQEATLQGNVVDVEGSPISYATILVSEVPSEESPNPTTIQGATTDVSGKFIVENLEPKQYQLIVSYVGFESISKTVEATSTNEIYDYTLQIDASVLDEVVVTARRPTIEKEAGKLVFHVENSALSVGNTFDLLKKTPGVIVIGDQIRVKNATPVIFLNGKRAYLAPNEIISLLKNLDASTVQSVEVITNPSAKYDAEAGTVLNIISSQAVSIGYKGNIRTNYEQAIFPKYSFGTSQFYKNQWLNLYGSYNFSPRKEYKNDENYIRFFEPDGSTNSIWESDFERITRSKAHQGNMIADFKVNEKHSISVAANVFVSPNMTYDNNVDAIIFDAQRTVDSTFITQSAVDIDQHNLAFNVSHTWKLSDAGAQVIMNANYINYKKEQDQSVNTDYFLPNGDFLRNNSFQTFANQQSDIVTAQLDFSIPALSGTIETGVKYSDIDTESGLDFFDTEGNVAVQNNSLSDLFMYKEAIYAGYFNYERSINKWNFSLGVRSEYTEVEGDSRSLGQVNTQDYWELFPSASINHDINEQHSIGAAYARRIERPRYQSLNPFLYFLNENNFNSGNPNLTPAIETKIGLDYSFKNMIFVEAYYQEFDNALGLLTFQDNETRTLQSIDANLITDFQYSLDIVFAKTLQPWWYMSMVTSTFYMENEFFTVKSTPETYSHNVVGFYAQMLQNLTLSKEQNLSSTITALYISNILYGNYNYKNQFNLSVSFRKQFWDNRASLAVGVDDIFNTNNVPLTSRFYNQDNSYFAQKESRLFRVSFQYNFGNIRLKDNNRGVHTDEGDRLQGQ